MDTKKTHSIIYKSPNNIFFEENEKLEVNQTETSIELELPTSVNDKLDREVVVVVKGSSTCPSTKLSDDLRKRINMTESEKGWIAATFPVGEIIVNLNIIYEASFFCSFHCIVSG